MDVYWSNDNLTWTLIQQFDRPTTYDVNGSTCKVDLEFPSVTARYFKVVNSDPFELTAAGGYSYGCTEIEAY